MIELFKFLMNLLKIAFVKNWNFDDTTVLGIENGSKTTRYRSGLANLKETTHPFSFHPSHPQLGIMFLLPLHILLYLGIAKKLSVCECVTAIAINAWIDLNEISYTHSSAQSLIQVR